MTEEPFSQVQERLNQSSLTLNAAANDVVHAAKGPTGQLANASSKFSHSYQDFQHSGLTLAGQIKDKETQDQLINDLRKTSTVSSKLLLASKSLAADPNAPNAKNLLAAAAKLEQLVFLFFQSILIFRIGRAVSYILRRHVCKFISQCSAETSYQ